VSKRIGRRQFLTAATAGASWAASVASAKVNPIRTGLLSTQHGHLNGKLKAMLDSPHYEVVAACEPDETQRRKRQSEELFQGLRWVSQDELLSDSSIDLVVVECRVWDAIPFGNAVIAANKHLHLEKPPTEELEPFRRLVEDAREKKLLLQMGYLWRFHEGSMRAFEAMQQGWLGDVYMVRGTINTNLDDEARAVAARYDGGIMFELGCHMVDRVVDFLGRPRATKSWIRHDTNRPDKLADNTLAVFEYERALGLTVSSALMPNQTEHRSLEIIGSDGSIMIQPMEPVPQMRVNMRRARGPYREGWQDIQLPPQPRYVADFKELARALQTETPLKYSYDYELMLQESVLRASGELA
jgi:predicted dehydrogenase